MSEAEYAIERRSPGDAIAGLANASAGVAGVVNGRPANAKVGGA